MSNPFYTNDEEVDDDEFLRRPRGGYMLPNSTTNGQQAQSQPQGGGVPSLEERRQQLMMKRREIEERTVNSSERSLGLLYESEKVGLETAEELSRQKEQLMRTEARLDDINSSLRTSERHLTGIKSMFGGIRNYFSGRSPSASGAAGGKQPALGTSASESSLSRQQPDRFDQIRNTSPKLGAHPATRMRGLEEDRPRNVDDILDQNLDHMSAGLSRLKVLAQGLNEELDDHNELLNRLDDKSANTNWRIDKQNKDMGKLLKK